VGRVGGGAPMEFRIWYLDALLAAGIASTAAIAAVRGDFPSKVPYSRHTSLAGSSSAMSISKSHILIQVIDVRHRHQLHLQ